MLFIRSAFEGQWCAPNHRKKKIHQTTQRLDIKSKWKCKKKVKFMNVMMIAHRPYYSLFRRWFEIYQITFISQKKMFLVNENAWFKMKIGELIRFSRVPRACKPAIEWGLNVCSSIFSLFDSIKIDDDEIVSPMQKQSAIWVHEAPCIDRLIWLTTLGAILFSSLL